MLKILWTDKVLNDEILQKIGNERSEIVSNIKWRKLQYLDHKGWEEMNA